MQRSKGLLILFAMLLCASTGWSQDRVTAGPLKLPATIIRKDGKGITQVTQPGEAECRRTSRTEAATALALTNAIRTRSGLQLLVTNKRLQKAAEAHACEMARRGTMTHTGANGSGPSDRVKRYGYKPRITAENIAAGHFDLARVHHEWARSPGHLANIMINELREYGIGYAVAPDGKAIFWTAVYAKRR